jgi:hypothetical protein
MKNRAAILSQHINDDLQVESATNAPGGTEEALLPPQCAQWIEDRHHVGSVLGGLLLCYCCYQPPREETVGGASRYLGHKAYGVETLTYIYIYIYIYIYMYIYVFTLTETTKGWEGDLSGPVPSPCGRLIHLRTAQPLFCASEGRHTSLRWEWRKKNRKERKEKREEKREREERKEEREKKTGKLPIGAPPL